MTLKMPLLAKILVVYTLVWYPLLKFAGYSQQVVSHFSGGISDESFEYLSYLPKFFGLFAIVASLAFILSGSGRIRIFIMSAFLIFSPLYNLLEPLFLFQLEPTIAQNAEIVRRSWNAQAFWFVASFGWSVAWLIYLLRSKGIAAWLAAESKAQ